MMDADRVFRLLSKPPRRRLMIALCDRERLQVPEDVRTRSTASSRSPAEGRSPGEPASLGAGSEAGDDESQLALLLHHRDLPLLDDEDVIEWDRDANTVSRGPEFGTIEPLLGLLVRNAESLPGDLY